MSGQVYGRVAALAEAIGAVREEVIRAQLAGQGEEFSFQVGPVEMEFEVTLARGDDFRGGLRVLVVTEDAGGQEPKGSKGGDVTTHRVKLTLEPVRLAGEEVAVS
jgi:hypothetical protein